MTSPHGARFLAARAAEENPAWFGCPVFAVGAATARAAARAGFSHIEAGDGDSAALASLVIGLWQPGSGLILHAAGLAAGEDLARELTASGLEAKAWPLYAMERATKLPRAAHLALTRAPVGPAGSAGIIAFYSAEAATAFLALVAEAGLTARLRDWTALSLSPRIHAALAFAPAPNLLRPAIPEFARTLIAARPDDAAMLAAATSGEDGESLPA